MGYSNKQIWVGYDRYEYSGPVLDNTSKKVLKNNWVLELYAMSREQALVKMAQQFKNRFNVNKRNNLEFTGELVKKIINGGNENV